MIAAALLVTVLPVESHADSDDDGDMARRPVLEPSGQFITPSAASGALFSTLDPKLAKYPNYRAGQAVSFALSPDRKTLLVLTSGYNTLEDATGAKDTKASSEFIFVYDISAHAPVPRQVLQIPAAYAGLAFAPDGQHFYVGSGGGDSIYGYGKGAAGWVQLGAAIPLGHKQGNGGLQGPSTAGIAISEDGARLAVANVYNDSLSLVHLTPGSQTAGAVSGELDLRPGKENRHLRGVPGGETPFWVVMRGHTAYVSSQRDREIDVVDVSGAAPVMRRRIAVRGTPNRMILDRTGRRLFVACDNDDSVQVIDTATARMTARILVGAPKGLLRPGPRYRGAAPNGLALSADEQRLYVSNGGENAIAVVDLHAPGHPATIALLPTGWYPNDVQLAGGWLYAINGKSDPGPNPGNCQESRAHSVPKTPAYAATCRTNQYILQLEQAGLLAEPLPDASDLTALTLQVGQNNGFLRKADPADDAMMKQLHQRIRHVIYIVKENRTYDQILGDLGRGNGDASITEFGRAITPNFHAIATNFVDLDNFYDSGEVSGNGWPWSTSGRETDFNVKTVPLQYSGRTTHAPYDAEGQVRNIDVGIATASGRHAAAPLASVDPDVLPGTASDDAADGPDDTTGADTQHGFLWNAALKAGLSVRNYGFFYDLNRYFLKDTAIPEDRTPFADTLQVGYPVNPTLIPLSDIYFRGFDNIMPDYWRFTEWNREFTEGERTGRMPSLTLLRLMHDHMGSFGKAIDGINTPELQQADNDYAVGLVAERIAHSRFRGNTLIFVIEDDAQDGPDHVDAHRSTAYVIGPYVRQGAVVSSRYTTVNMLRTIEDILGTEHLNLNDAYQQPMTAVFDLARKDWSFTASPSPYLYATALPLPRHADAGPVPGSTHQAAYWAAQTAGYDWAGEDRVPAVPFNQLVWHGLFGDRPYPETRSGTNFRALH